MTQQVAALRQATCELLGDALADLGHQLWHAAALPHDARLEALAVVIQMAGELGQGASAMFANARWYAGAALVRQLFEAQYLLARFTTEPAVAEGWLGATKKQLENHFRPGQMRQAGGFSASE